MFAQMSQTSGSRFPRRLGIAMTSAVLLLALIRSAAIAGEQETTGQPTKSDFISVQNEQ